MIRCLNVFKYFLENPAPAAGACPPPLASLNPFIAFSSRVFTGGFLSFLRALTEIVGFVVLTIRIVLFGYLSPSIVLSGELTRYLDLSS